MVTWSPNDPFPTCLFPSRAPALNPSGVASLASGTPWILGEVRHEVLNGQRLRANIQEQLVSFSQGAWRKSEVFRRDDLDWGRLLSNGGLKLGPGRRIDVLRRGNCSSGATSLHVRSRTPMSGQDRDLIVNFQLARQSMHGVALGEV